jgi:two-component sensor histidine kinase
MIDLKFTLFTGLLIIGILCNRFAIAQTPTAPAQTTFRPADSGKGAIKQPPSPQVSQAESAKEGQSNVYLQELNDLKREQQQFQKVLAGGILLLLVLCLLLIRTWRLYRRTEQQRQLLDLQAADLQAINANKDKLFSIVSHDLRTPVNNLHYLLQDLRQTNWQSQEWPPLLGQLTDRVGVLGRLINNLLYWSLVQQGLLRDREEQVDLSEIMVDCLAVFNDTIQRKELDVRVSGPMPHIRSDENQMLIIIRNLVDNAVKFSPVKGTIQVQWTNSSSGLLLDVYNATAPQSELSTGANLGLRLVNDLVTRQKGSVKTQLLSESFWQVSIRWPANLVVNEVELSE